MTAVRGDDVPGSACHISESGRWAQAKKTGKTGVEVDYLPGKEKELARLLARDPLIM